MVVLFDTVACDVLFVVCLVLLGFYSLLVVLILLIAYWWLFSWFGVSLFCRGLVLDLELVGWLRPCCVVGFSCSCLIVLFAL